MEINKDKDILQLWNSDPDFFYLKPDRSQFKPELVDTKTKDYGELVINLRGEDLIYLEPNKYYVDAQIEFDYCSDIDDDFIYYLIMELTCDQPLFKIRTELHMLHFITNQKVMYQPDTGLIIVPANIFGLFKNKHIFIESPVFLYIDRLLPKMLNCKYRIKYFEHKFNDIPKKILYYSWISCALYGGCIKDNYVELEHVKNKYSRYYGNREQILPIILPLIFCIELFTPYEKDEIAIYPTKITYTLGDYQHDCLPSEIQTMKNCNHTCLTYYVPINRLKIEDVKEMVTNNYDLPKDMLCSKNNVFFKTKIEFTECLKKYRVRFNMFSYANLIN